MSFRSSALLKAIKFLERFQVDKSTIGAVADGRREQRAEAVVRYLSLKKFWNFWKVEFQLRSGRSWVSAYPYEWEIDTTNICQLSCPLCHTGLGTVHRDQGVMHYETFTKTIDEIKDYAMWLSLYSWGEPFLNKDIHRFVEYAHKANIATSMSSNLNKPLTPEMAESIILSGLDTLIVSLDGTTQDVYEQYRVNGHLDWVFKNLRLLVEKKRELGFKTPYIEWQFIVMRQNQHQIPEAHAMANEIGVDGIIFKKVDFPLGEDDTEISKKWLPVGIEKYLRDHPFDRPYEETGDRCWRLWRSTVVNWDGGVAPCCYLTDKADDFGDVTDQSFKSIWNNEKFRSARQLFNSKEHPTVHVGCQTCPVYTGSAAARDRSEELPSYLGPATIQTPLKIGRGRAGASGGTSDGLTGIKSDLEEILVVSKKEI